MRLIGSALLYLALVVSANAATAADTAALKALAGGDMRKLVFAEVPAPVSDQPFTRADTAGSATLAEWRGKYLLLNFWATWCAPCRKEMPTLSALQAEFGGERFEVLTLATGRNRPDAIARFLSEAGIANLPGHTDPKQAVARDMSVLGLPVSVLIDPEGREIARLVGDADWHSDAARAIVSALIR
ncbi:MAG: TlpA family protein disulfide reductase [Jhaorihella sp.]